MAIKFCATVGNIHAKCRVSPFFDTKQEVGYFMLHRNDCIDSIVEGYANWEEHQRWNRERVGMYADCPVAE